MGESDRVPLANHMLFISTLAVDRTETSQLCAARSAETEQLSSLLQDNQLPFVSES